MAPPEWPSSPPRATERKKTRPPRTVPKKWLHNNRSRGSDGGRLSLATTHSSANGALALSDLSGSYMHDRDTSYTSVASRVNPAPSWRHAHVLSPALPYHPQPRTECDDSVGIDKRRATATTLLTESSAVVKVIRPDEVRERQSPLLILLMDPSRKLYEFMQLWVDVETDSVRDVLNAIRSALLDKEWQQAYDGLFQVRDNHFSQVIHILRLRQYDVQPHEVWIAKPCSMAGQTTAAHAVELLNYLKGADVLMYSSLAANRKTGGLIRPKKDDAVLVLTKEARSRTFVLGSVLKHHHASQFLTFTPPFEPMVVRVDVLSGDDDDDIDCCSQLSDSSCSGMSLESRDSLVSVTDLIAARTPWPKKIKVNSFGKASRYPSDASSSLDGEPKKTRSLGRALSMLNCASGKQRDSAAFYSSSTMGSTFNGPLWNVWEDESKVVSDSAPLIARPSAYSATIMAPPDAF